MPVKKIVVWVTVIFLVYSLLTRPTGTAYGVYSVFEMLKSAGRTLATFVSSL